MSSNSNKNFYNRLSYLAGIKKDNVNESKNTATSTLIDYKRSNDGTAFGIVKENHNYIIKKSSIKNENLSASDFAYINGYENKSRFEYKSLAEADKQRNLYIRNINEAFDLGGVYYLNEDKSTKAPSLDVNKDFSSIIKSRINESKKNILVEKEKKFKDSLVPSKIENNKKGLIPENAEIAIKKALGLIKEEAIVTADSEIKEKDKISEKTGKEESTAPINDKNAKKEADKATATNKEGALKKGGDSKSIAVNQADKPLHEGEDLSTADSQIIVTDSVANLKTSKESSQAPVNDENAKKEAEKRNAKGSASAAISNNTEEQPESNPFEDKENACDEKSDIVSEDVNKGKPFDKKKAGGKNIVAADSEQKESDKIANETGHKKPDAPYNNYNQPEKGHKEQKGAELKPSAKEKSLVSENDIVTADSEQKESDIIANDVKVNLPKKTGKSTITADSEINPEQSLANKTTTNLPKFVTESVNEDDDGKNELDAAAAALDDLDIAVDAEQQPSSEPTAYTQPETDTETKIDTELVQTSANEPSNDIENTDSVEDAESEPEGDIPSNDSKGGDDDLMTKEIEKLVGKVTQKVRNTELTPQQAKGFLKSIVDSFEDHIKEVDIEDRKEISDKILKAQGEISTDDDSNSGENVETGMDKDAKQAIDQKIDDLKSGGDIETPAGEPVDDEPVKEAAEMSDSICAECGPFEAYMESRGYSSNSLDECSATEMANLVSAYAKAHEDGLNDGDFEKVAIYVTPDVANEVIEYGQGSYIEKLQPYIDKISEDQLAKFGSHEPTLPPVAEDEDDEIEATSSASASDEPDAVTVPDSSTSSFAAPAQTLGVATPSPAKKNVEIDLNNGKVSVQVNETEEKIRKYVRLKLEELSHKRKPRINESKSESLKKLDKLIEQQWKLHGKDVIEDVIAKQFSK